MKLGIAGAAVLGGGTFVYRSFGRFGPAAAGFRIFDAYELSVLEAVCDAHFPGTDGAPSAKEAGCAAFVDRYLSELYSEQHTLVRALLRTLNLATVVTHGRTFRFLSVEDRADVLATWASSSLRLRRAGKQSLSFIINLGYFENERVREVLGYTHGCEISQEGRPQGI